MRHFLTALLVMILTAHIAIAQSQPVLNLELANKIADAAQEKATSENWNVVITILDQGGNLILLKKMDGTQIGSIEVAQLKAKTAFEFKRPTKVFEDMIKGGAVHLNTMPITAVEGGLPIFKDEHIIGAIGISGVTSVQDGIIAEAALKAVSLN
ncbi:heme-binding protein [Belliella kenyensis]|uniref:Heme-binding protein n=1 Tax=Belliella kenyensis TaxID=1472724 RepID=A0ABV8EMK3_9BACT|nr:heme-binding protein [Belliella kenyensis]MCH7401596.1 heme-binding protein [Belliella kenyensis]MDN3603124.1 heme-binding protein [Belliella kenyensis]